MYLQAQTIKDARLAERHLSAAGVKVAQNTASGTWFCPRTGTEVKLNGEPILRPLGRNTIHVMAGNAGTDDVKETPDSFITLRCPATDEETVMVPHKEEGPKTVENIELDEGDGKD